MTILEQKVPRQSPPAYSRVLEAATGDQPWTTTELESRDDSPRWLIAEAQAHLQLALLETEESARDVELRAALELIAKLPTPKMRETCFELLQTYLPPAAHAGFARLFREIVVHSAAPRMSSPWPMRAVGVVAVSLATVLLVLSVVPQQLPPELVQTVIESHGSSGGLALVRGNDARIHSDEAFVYTAEVKTVLPQAWLLHFRDVVGADGQVHIVLRPFENEAGMIRIVDQPPRQALDCLDYYLVLVPHQPQALDNPIHEDWLAQLRTAVIQAAQDKLDREQLEQIVHRQWRAAGFTDEVKVQIDRFQRTREPRS